MGYVKELSLESDIRLHKLQHGSLPKSTTSVEHGLSQRHGLQAVVALMDSRKTNLIGKSTEV